MSILDLEALQAVTGYKNAVDIALCLSRQGIKYVVGKRGRIWTTITAVNAAMGITEPQPREIEEKRITLADFGI